MKEQPKSNSRMPYILELYVRELAKRYPKYQYIVNHLDELKEAIQQ